MTSPEKTTNLYKMAISRAVPLLVLLFSFTGGGHSANENSDCTTNASFDSPEKFVARAPIAVKALLTSKHPDPVHGTKAFVAEFWILDVLKGTDKLAAALGVMGGRNGVINLRDQ